MSQKSRYYGVQFNALQILCSRALQKGDSCDFLHATPAQPTRTPTPTPASSIFAAKIIESTHKSGINPDHLANMASQSEAASLLPKATNTPTSVLQSRSTEAETKLSDSTEAPPLTQIPAQPQSTPSVDSSFNERSSKSAEVSGMVANTSETLTARPLFGATGAAPSTGGSLFSKELRKRLATSDTASSISVVSSTKPLFGATPRLLSTVSNTGGSIFGQGFG